MRYFVDHAACKRTPAQGVPAGSVYLSVTDAGSCIAKLVDMDQTAYSVGGRMGGTLWTPLWRESVEEWLAQVGDEYSTRVVTD